MDDGGAARAARPIGVGVTTPYLPELESLRGLAILLVLLFHIDALIEPGLMRIGGQVVSPPIAYVRAGHSGVNLFFILSAFLLSLPFLAQAAGEVPVSVPRYFTRRALRILPLYYAAVATAAVLSAATPDEVLRGVPYLCFLQSFNRLTVRLHPFSDVWWSLATEAQFYLVLPLVPIALSSRRGRVIAVVGLALWAALYAAHVLQKLPLIDTIEGELYFGLSILGRAPTFLAGIAAAWLYLHHGEALRRRWASSAWLRGGGADLVLLAVLTAFGLFLRWVVWIGPFRRAPLYEPWHVVEALFWTTVLLLLLLAPLRLKPLVTNRLLNRLGVLSYSVYILHLPVIVFSLGFLRRFDPLVGWNARTAAVAPLLFALCLALAQLTYRGIERPFLVRKQRVRV